MRKSLLANATAASTANSSTLSASLSVGVQASSGLSATQSAATAASTANSSSLSATQSVGVQESSGLSATQSAATAASTANSSSLSASQSVGVQASSGLSATQSAATASSTANSSTLSASQSVGTQVTAVPSVRSFSGEMDIDIDQADYTSYQQIFDVIPISGECLDVELVIDLDKTTTGFADQHAAQTVQFIVTRSFDGSATYREEDASETDAVSGTNAANKMLRIPFGNISSGAYLRVYVKLSAENAVDVEFPYVLTLLAKADPSIIAVSAT